MMYGTVPADHIVGANLGAGCGKGLQSLGTTVLCGMMDDHKIRFPQIEIGRTYPVWRFGNRIDTRRQRMLTDNMRPLPGLFFVRLVAGLIGIDLARR